MLTTLNGVLLTAAVVILLWSFERYRRRFVQTDLLIGIALATGLTSVALLPGLFDQLGRVIDIQDRFLVVSLLANLTLLILLLYYAEKIQRVRDDVTELTRTLSVDQAPTTDGGTREPRPHRAYHHRVPRRQPPTVRPGQPPGAAGRTPSGTQRARCNR